MNAEIVQDGAGQGRMLAKVQQAIRSLFLFEQEHERRHFHELRLGADNEMNHAGE